MPVVLTIAIAMACMILLSSCAGAQSRAPVVIDKVELSLSTAAELNRFDNRPHALHLRIFQLDDTAMLRRTIRNYDALIGMMEKHFSHEQVVGMTDLMLRPSSRSRITIKPLPAAAYLAVLAGYYQPASLSAMILVFPLHIADRKLGADAALASVQYDLTLHFSANAMRLRTIRKE